MNHSLFLAMWPVGDDSGDGGLFALVVFIVVAVAVLGALVQLKHWFSGVLFKLTGHESHEMWCSRLYREQQAKRSTHEPDWGLCIEQAETIYKEESQGPLWDLLTPSQQAEKLREGHRLN